MSSRSHPESNSLVVTPGDLLISNRCIPNPTIILSGFRRKRRSPKIEPFVSFGALQQLLEFLECVVLTERLIVPIPNYSEQTERIIQDRKLGDEFAVWYLLGELDFTREQIIDRLETAGILYEAKIAVGEQTADDVGARILRSSKICRSQFEVCLKLAAQVKGYDKIGLARAHFASSVGVAIHVAEAAGLAGIPYMLGSSEEGYVRGYEQENFRLRRSVGQILLNRLNAGARAELCKLAELGVMSVFPETPIASLIVQNASSPRGMLEVAIELRNEFASYRRHMNQMEYDLANKDQPLRLQLKRLRELEHLAGALWPGAQTDLKTTALGISEALLAIPEVVGTPSASSLGGLVAKLGSLPVEKLMDVYRRRKIRLLLKAKSNFLKGHDATAKIGSILGVPEEIVRRSRVQGRARPRGR